MTLPTQRKAFSPLAALLRWGRKALAVATVASAFGLVAACAPLGGGGDSLPAAAFTTDANPEADVSNYQLGTGDRVKVTVFGHEDLSGEFVIDGSGRVAMPLIQEVEAASLTARELEARIADRLDPEYLRDPRVSVEVMNYRPFYILGEVKQPGSYQYVNGMSAWNAVALAGGFTYRAKKDYVNLRRAGAEGEGQRVPLNTPVMPGDVLEVDERFF